MILRCPQCATRFLVDPATLGPAGRTVRCGACGHHWHQGPAAVRDLAVSPAAALPVPVAAPIEAPEAEPRPAKPAKRRRHRSVRGQMLSLALTVAILAVVLLAGYRFRGDIVSRWPESVRLYEALGVLAPPPEPPGPKAPAE